MKYGDILKKLRNSKGLSQREFADRLKINRSTYARYETSSTQPDYETLKKLASFHDVTVDYILGLSDKKQPHPSGLTDKDEKDIAKRMAALREDLANAEGLSFHGEPMSEEAVESLLEAMEYAERQATRVNKKYIPKKYRKGKDN